MEKIWFVNKTENNVYRIDPTDATLDVAIKSIDAPLTENFTAKYYSNGFNVCGSIAPIVTIVNNGTTTITSADISYTIDGSIPNTFSWTGSFLTNATAQVILPTITPSTGTHLLRVTISNANGVTDDVEQNNTMMGSFRTIDPVQPIPFTEDFAGTNFPPANWNYVHFNRYDFMSHAAVGGFGLSVGSLKMNNYSGSMNITGQQDYFISPRLDFSTATATANSLLRFNVAYARDNAASADRLQIVASTDCGVTWNVVYDKSGSTLVTAPNTTASFTPTATQWRTDSVSLAAYAGQPELIIMFTSISNYGNNFYLDDIFIGDLSVGVSENAFANSFNVFPNPASDVLNLTFNNNASNDNVNMVMTDIAGKEIYSLEEINLSPDQTKTIQLKTIGLAKGMYFLALSQGSSRASKKIIIE